MSGLQGQSTNHGGDSGNKLAQGVVYRLIPYRIAPAILIAQNSDHRLHFEQHVLPHLDAAWGLARALAFTTSDAEDVLQEALLRAYRYYDNRRHDNVRAWILTIVRNTFYTMHAASPAAHFAVEFDEDIHGIDSNTPSPESKVLADSDSQRLMHAIERLPLEFREVLVLREFEEFSYKEIVEITGLKIGTVMSRLARARQKLLQLLSAEPETGITHAMP